MPNRCPRRSWAQSPPPLLRQPADAPRTVVMRTGKPSPRVSPPTVDQRLGELAREAHVSEELAVHVIASCTDEPAQQGEIAPRCTQAAVREMLEVDVAGELADGVAAFGCDEDIGNRRLAGRCFAGRGKHHLV